MQVLMHYRGSYLTAVICVILFCMLLVFQTPVDEVPEGMCACKDCVRQQTHSVWFNELYDLSVQPLLTQKNYVLSEDIFKFWKGLQKNKREGNYTAVVEKLFSLFPDKTQYSDASPKRCRTCAVIGNSGNLKGSHYGHLIDLHDFVISTYKRVRTSIKANRHKVMILHPAFIKYVHETWLLKRAKYPSTGFLAIIFALHVCDQVSTFGFGADQYGNWYHYFEKTSHKIRTGAHSGSFEFDTMMQLYLENKIQVYRGR
ncbi:CMP-N-acetylneuraminate-beta-galactosamide-alpha-2,3-sialyltransferase 1 isoform X2 [Carassius gibelio]|uniref:CMP-N-acetylneuraminate-beta-galactosamide- alpha-2,3-sialyltransferase 1 isoform X2 n=1 Tax=Carassius gibelio TaxID=101364 RepID=UPI0022776749|nr:CMP-N-acetylneuraminate-beta-galactosamide-alpha-2,3-sialyltransferase 1 isoform X2 [Carassius gibelio]